MSILRRYGVLIVIVVVVVALAFVFRDRLTGSAGDLQVGDCFDVADPASESVEEVPHHPCTEAHSYEVFFNATATGGSDAAYPGLDAFEAVVRAQCLPAFATYVGIPLDSSALDIGYLYPRTEGWGKGDRTITCYISRTDDAKMTSSMKGAKQ